MALNLYLLSLGHRGVGAGPAVDIDDSELFTSADAELLG